MANVDDSMVMEGLIDYNFTGVDQQWPNASEFTVDSHPNAEQGLNRSLTSSSFWPSDLFTPIPNDMYSKSKPSSTSIADNSLHLQPTDTILDSRTQHLILARML
jgi:hypothetical protein